jgi:hypothetical protein
VLHNNQSIKVRLYGVDAPESKQAFGTRAQQITSQLAFGQQVTIYGKGVERCWRVLGWVFVGKTSVNSEMEKAHSLGVRLKAQQTRQQRGTQPQLRPWTAEEEQLLGAVTDAKVAQRIARAVANVGIHRRGLGIPAYTQ